MFMSISLHELGGLWRRSLIAWPDGRQDRTTEVFWLQGPSHYIDLRQPAGRPSFNDVTCLDDLSADQINWLAGQEGFAGLFNIEAGIGEWHRAIDFQPWSGTADRGTLAFEGDILVEHGIEIPYLEHWHQALAPAATEAYVLEDLEAGLKGLFVRYGDFFMYTRDRSMKLPEPDPSNCPLEGAALRFLVAQSSAHDARAIIDCEISFGRIMDDVWLITNSSLPFREGMLLTPERDGDNFAVADISARGEAFHRVWKITFEEKCA